MRATRTAAAASKERVVVNLVVTQALVECIGLDALADDLGRKARLSRGIGRRLAGDSSGLGVGVALRRLEPRKQAAGNRRMLDVALLCVRRLGRKAEHSRVQARRRCLAARLELPKLPVDWLVLGAHGRLGGAQPVDEEHACRVVVHGKSEELGEQPGAAILAVAVEQRARVRRRRQQRP